MHKDAQNMPCDSRILHGGMTQVGEGIWGCEGYQRCDESIASVGEDA